MSLLNEIIYHKQEEIALQKKKVTKQMLMRDINIRSRDFIKALSTPELSLIAEIKYRSPSAGVLPDMRAPVIRARDYEQCGAQAISVLTDDRFFGGSREHLKEVRANTGLPVLRKDFILDEYQIYESRFIGADAILLIVRLINERVLKRFIKIANELIMTPLVEVGTEDEIAQAVNANAQCIGINNRDLDTLEIDLGRSIRLKKYVPEHYITIAESGIKSREDMQKIEGAGFNGVLIGHALAVSPCAQDAIESLQGGSSDRA